MKTVLVVEDEKLIRKGLVTMIGRAPTETETVLEAKNGLQALEILRAQPVDVLVTDIRMPGMDGMELVAKTKSLPQVPLAVVVSGYDDFNYAVEMLRSGVKDYLLKPVEREKLWAVLAKLDAELQTTQKARAGAEELRRQALRYLMLDDGVPLGERQKLLERYGADFGTRPYRVLCCAAGSTVPGAETVRECLPVLERLPALREQLQDIRGRQVLLLDANADLPAGLRGGISTAQTGLGALHTGYTQALAGCRRAWFDETPQLCTGLNIVQGDAPAPAENPVPEKELQKMVQLLGASHWQEASAALRAQVTRVRRDELTPTAFEQAARHLGEQLLTAYRTMLDAEDSELNVVTSLWQYPNAEDYLTAVRGWMEQFTHRLLHEFDDYRNKQKIRDAVLYIQKNYTAVLNMAIVSNAVDMNYSLFSLLFKQYVGTNFVAYLQGLRITEAKRLLRETDLRVNEIGRRVGFADDKNFLKVFKAAESVSPSEYRRGAQYKES